MKKKVAIIIIAISLLIGIFSVPSVKANAIKDLTGVFADTAIEAVTTATSIPVKDTAEAVREKKKEWTDVLWDWVKSLGTVAYKNALRTYVNNLAYQAAVYIASGSSGQKPAFEHRTIGQILLDEANVAVGDTLDKMMTTYGVGDFCNLDPKIGLKLSANAIINLRPTQYQAGRCSFTQATKNVIDKLNSGPFISISGLSEEELRASVRVGAISGEETKLAKVKSQNEQLGVEIIDAEANLEKLNKAMATATPEEKKKIQEEAGYATLHLTELQDQRNKLQSDINYLQPIVDSQRRNTAANLTNDVTLGAFTQNLGSNSLTDVMKFQEEVARAGAEASAKATLSVQSGLLTNIMPPVSTVMGFSKTPISVTTDFVKQNLAKVGLPETTFTGDLLADAADTFLNTLASKMLQKWLFQGMINPPEPTQSGFYAGGGQKFGRTQAQEQFADFIAPSFITNQSISPLGDLNACPDPSKPGLENCAIDNGFRQAIEQGLTVRQAMQKGYLKGDATFGYSSGGGDLTYLQGYPYRSLALLRKYRVLPIGWELAAQWIGSSGFNKEGKAFTLQQVIDGFNDSKTPSPFYQLVDPDWVLVMPDAACFKKGPGPEILARQTVQGVAGGESFKEIISRGDYCADVRTCLQKRDDGSCKAYGYCLEEEEIFKPTGTACPAYATSCTTYKKVNGNQETISLLARSLDGANVCTAQDAGCKWYANAKNKDGQWQGTADSRIYFNNKLESCPAEQNGCSLYYNFPSPSDVAGKSSAIANGSFEFDAKGKAKPDGWDINGSVIFTTPAWHGGRALLFNSAGDLSQKTISLPAGTWTASVWCKGSCVLDFNGDQSPVDDTKWAQATVNSTVSEGAQITVKIYAKKDAVVDGVMVVAGGTPASGYADYGDVGADKLYLNGTGEVAACNANTVGTKMYTDDTSGLKFAGKYDTANACPTSCVGYTQWNLEPFLNTEKATNVAFIKDEAKMCRASSVGCEGFVNLEAKTVGGEAVQYFAQYQSCLPWDEAGASRGTYYSWVGSDTAGFALRAWYFEKDPTNKDWPAPATKNKGSINSIICTTDDDIKYNPDCVTLYQQGHPDIPKIINVSLAKEVSKDCRRFKQQSTGSEMTLNPNRATQCSAPEVGCRRFTGKRAALSKIIYKQDFESMAVPTDWNIKQDARLLISSNASQFLKHSLAIMKDGAAPIIYDEMSNKVKAGNSYQIQIWGKAGAVSMYFTDNIDTNLPTSEKVALTFKNDWDSQNAFFDNIKTDSKYLVVELGSDSVYFDALSVREAQDEFYAVKNSWPAHTDCDTATKGGVLSCNRYTADNGNKFTATMVAPSDPAAIGCRAVTQTFNSPFPSGATISDKENPDVKINLPAHKTAYRVITDKTQCQAEFMGCRALGAPNFDEKNNVVKSSFTTIFAKDNPFDYSRTLCSSSLANGCEAYTADIAGRNQTLYFKDPGAKKCEYREGVPGSPSGWSLVGSDGKQICQLKTADNRTLNVTSTCRYYSPPPTEKNIKEGWYRPDGTACSFITRTLDSAMKAKCESKPALPPSSAFNLFGRIANAQSNVNVVDDPTKMQIMPSECYPTVAEANSDPLGLLPSDYNIRSSSKINGDLDGLVGQCNDQFNSCTQYLNPEPSKIDFALKDAKGRLIPFVSGSGRAYYVLANSVDEKSCNGQVNRAQGCRLFEQVPLARLYESAKGFVNANGALKTEMNIIDGQPIASGALNDSNVLLSVKKERQCSSWLACKSAIIDTNEKGQPQNICLAVGACNQLSDSGESCLSPVADLNLPVDATAENMRAGVRNMSGYGQVSWSSDPKDKDKNGLLKLAGPMNFGSADQVGKIALVPNGNFEQAPKDNGEPAFWSIVSTDNSSSFTDQEIFVKKNEVAAVASIRTISGEPSSAKIYEGNTSVKLSQTDYASKGVCPMQNVSLASSSFAVSTGSPYVVSAKVLVQNLESDFANAPACGPPLKDKPFVGLKVFCNDPKNPSKYLEKNNLSVNNKADETLGKWQTLLFKFYSDDSNSCKVIVGFMGYSAQVKGSLYVDDVDIKPVLEMYKNKPVSNLPDTANPLLQVARSCRLYPSSSALSCVAEENGKTMYGQEGYCYTPDPNNMTQCLQWWPLDILQGEQYRSRLDQFTPYKGPRPLYMCVLGRGNAKRKVNVNFIDSYFVEVTEPGEATLTNYAGQIASTYLTVSNIDRPKKDFGGWAAYRFNPDNVRVEDVNNFEFSFRPSAGTTNFVVSGQTSEIQIIDSNNDIGRRYYKREANAANKWKEQWLICSGFDKDKLTNENLDKDKSACEGVEEQAKKKHGDVFMGYVDINRDKNDAIKYGKITEFGFRAADGTGDKIEGITVVISLGLKEYCLAFAEVVDDSGNAVPWAKKFADINGWNFPGVIWPSNKKNYQQAPFGASTFTGASKELNQPVPISATDDPAGSASSLLGGTTSGAILYGGVPLACEGVCGETGSLGAVARGQKANKKGVCDATGVACSTNTDCTMGNFSLLGDQNNTSEICYGVPVDALPESLTIKNLPNLQNVPRNQTFIPQITKDDNEITGINTILNKNIIGKAQPARPWLTLGAMYPVGFKALCWNGQQYTEDECTKSYGMSAKGQNQTAYDYTQYIHINKAGQKDAPNFRPSVSNARITCRGDKALQLEFSANANPEQLPIKALKIDWGADSSVDYISNLSLDNQKIKLFHTYDSAESMKKALGNLVKNDIKIKIGVQDNWGWCSPNPGADDATHQPWPNSCLDKINSMTELGWLSTHGNVTFDRCSN